MKYLKLFENIDPFEEDWDEEEIIPKKVDKFNYKVINADTLSELQTKSLGLHHDHCHHVYFGKTNGMRKGLKKYSNGQSSSYTMKMFPI